MTNDIDRAVEHLTEFADELSLRSDMIGNSIARVHGERLRLILSANREMREEPRVLAVTLEGMQGEPAGMMTVGVQMTDGQKFDLIRTNGTVISHWARLPDAEARSALTTQRGDGE